MSKEELVELWQSNHPASPSMHVMTGVTVEGVSAERRRHVASSSTTTGPVRAANVLLGARPSRQPAQARRRRRGAARRSATRSSSPRRSAASTSSSSAAATAPSRTRIALAEFGRLRVGLDQLPAQRVRALPRGEPPAHRRSSSKDGKVHALLPSEVQEIRGGRADPRLRGQDATLGRTTR